MRILPFIMAGGSGSRLWPASNASRPKQFLPLADPVPLIRHAYFRVKDLEGGLPPVILTTEPYEPLVRESLPEVDPDQIWCEPQGRNTGPCIAWAVHEIQAASPRTVAVFLPADHLFQEEGVVREAILDAASAVSEGEGIALLGIRPDRPETGFGYIEAAADPLPSGLLQVRRFLEKPGKAVAEKLVKRRDTYWNSGIFVVQVAAGRRFIREASENLGEFMANLPAPGTARQAGASGRAQLARAFEAVGSVPFDSAVLEHHRTTLLRPLEAGWSDLGSWEAILAASRRDEGGNSVSSGSLAVDTQGCLLRAEKGKIVALGVRDLVIVSWGDLVLVCPRGRVQEIRHLVAALQVERKPLPAEGGGGS